MMTLSDVTIDYDYATGIGWTAWCKQCERCIVSAITAPNEARAEELIEEQLLDHEHCPHCGE